MKGHQQRNLRMQTVESSTSESRNLSHQNDIVGLILEDHKRLKELIKIMKDTDKEETARQDAFAEFAPALICHAKPEEQTLYVYMKSKEDLRAEGFEGDVEHQLADQLVEEIMRTDDNDLWSARVKVLAELVEHHIEEEESELLPDFKKNSQSNERDVLGAKFIDLKTDLLAKGATDSPHENKLTGYDETH